MPMRWLSVVIVAVAACQTCVAQDKAKTIHFSMDDVGKVPAGWKVDKTGPGEGSVWKVEADETAPSGKGYVLAQKAEGPRPLFNLCVVEDGRYRDLELSVRFKALKGKIDQGGGVVWRYRDANNYYIARYNPLEGNYRVYKVEGGKRTQLDSAEDLKVPAGEWHTLTIRQSGNRIEGLLDGKPHLEATDGTFAEAGRVGVWTKADAQTVFDTFTVTEK
jgi:hypothetical protein